MNPKGIPCLYLADQLETAMSEVRPWIGAHVSIGHFKTERDLRIVNCATPRAEFRISDLTATGGQLTDLIWGDISHAFSQPVTETDSKAAYAPTQILAEVFRSIGCDGIRYRSLLGEGGDSYALFCLENAKLTKCAVCTVTGIRHIFSAETEAYAVADDGTLITAGDAPSDDSDIDLEP